MPDSEAAPAGGKGRGGARRAAWRSRGAPYVAVFRATFVLWQGAELVLNTRRRSKSPADERDRGSFRLLGLLLGTAFSLDFACALLLPGAAVVSAARTLFVVGIGCVLAGTGLRWYAVATLGRFFTVQVAAQASQPVIDVGPYRYIRHPAYGECFWR